MRSAASSTSSKPPESLTYLLDESLDARTVADSLRATGAAVLRATELFPRGTEDAVWLAVAGKRNWVVLTRDQRIRYRQLEKLSLVEARVRAFVFTGGNVTVKDTAATLAQSLAAIESIARSEVPPFIYNITRTGALRRVV